MPHFNRVVDDPLLPCNEYKEYSYIAAAVGEVDPEKALDLHKLHFSLDDFQKLSKGTYNAGEFRITDSGKLDIVNNHKVWTMFNHKAVDGQDAYAIRVAFAKAMAAGGLDKKAMKAVRQALGLGPGYTLSNCKAFTPLTRQEVRELIDANIATLNAGREPDNQLKTYAQIHARYSPEQKRDIAAAREEIARTGSAPKVDLNAELADVITVTKMNPSFEGLSMGDAEDYLEFIDQLSTALERLQDQDARYDWRRENGTEYKVSVQGGANGMSIALENGHVVFETLDDGKRSRIDFGLSPEKLQARLDHSQELLNRIAVLEVDDTIVRGKNDTGDDDLSDDDVSQKPLSKKSDPSGNIRNEYGIEDDDLDLPKSNGIPSKITLDKPFRKAPVIPERIEIKEEDPAITRKLNARKNLDLLASLIAKQYDFDADLAAKILERIEDWEEQLADCGPAGHPETLADLNDDLRDFLLNNRESIEGPIQEASAGKGELY